MGKLNFIHHCIDKYLHICKTIYYMMILFHPDAFNDAMDCLNKADEYNRNIILERFMAIYLTKAYAGVSVNNVLNNMFDVYKLIDSMRNSIY